MINSFLDYLLFEKKYSVNTITAYKNDLISFRDFLLLEYNQDNLLEVHYPQIRNWIVSLVDADISNRTINRKVSSLKSFYKYLQKSEQIVINPLNKHKALKIAKKVQIPFTAKEINSVIENIGQESSFTSIRKILKLVYQ